MCKRSQVMLSCADQLFLLAGVNAGGSPAKILAAAQANFCKDQRFSIMHNQVNFTEATMIILNNKLQAPLS